MPRQTSPNAALFWKMEEMIKLLNIHLNHFPKHENVFSCRLYGLRKYKKQIKEALKDVKSI